MECFFWMTESIGAKPTLIKDIPEIADNPYEKSGILSRYLAWGSVGDLHGAIKRILEFPKTMMEERSKANAAKFALAMASSLGLPAEVIAEFR